MLRNNFKNINIMIVIEELIMINTEKLAKRLENNTIKGKGDNR